jgi:hypothetical protein
MPRCLAACTLAGALKDLAVVVGIIGCAAREGYLFARGGGGGTATADGYKSPSRLGAVVHSRLIPSTPPDSSRPPVLLSPTDPTH